MIPQDLIARKRDGRFLTVSEIHEFVAGLTDARVTEGQAAAFAMAVFFRGLSGSECAALATAMARSGRVLDWSADHLPGPVFDKHSTGGVGDLVSLVLAPMAAACGGFVPMISGRGLGHTGGTLDKLESIPGYVATPGEDLFRRVVREAGCAIIGQTADFAPADRRLYAIRDVTATVESIPLITASILSKKLSAGLQALVIDVKTGSGAFMRTLRRARALARQLVAVANGAGLKTVCVITDMDQPLAAVAGNALEARYAIDVLTGARKDSRLQEACVALTAEMLLLGNVSSDREDAARQATKALESGEAAERFARMTRMLGGPRDLLERPKAHLVSAPIVLDIVSDKAGFVRGMDARAIGMAVVALGGGRTRSQDGVDHAVGIDEIIRVGARVDCKTPFARVHARRIEDAEAAGVMLRSAIRIGANAPRPTPLIRERIGP